MGYIEAERDALQRWRAFQNVKTGVVFMATQIYDQKDRERVQEYLPLEEANSLLLGDAIILTPEGFLIERFIPFATLYRRVS